jgi:nitrogen-specific signal transduction histidine kinase
MESALQRIEKLSAEIARVPLDQEGVLARIHGALEEAEERLRLYVSGEEGAADALPTSSGPPGDGDDAARRMSEEARKIGHDLNNCLGIIGGRTELMAMYLDQGKIDAARRGVDVILGQMDRMRELTDRLRNLRDAG